MTMNKDSTNKDQMTKEKSETQINRVLPDLHVSDWKEAYDAMASYAAQDTGLNKKNLSLCLKSAEAATPSGIGRGIAIPQMIMNGIKKPYILFARLRNEVKMETFDSAPVGMVMLLISPRTDGPLHLQRLSRVTRIFRDPYLCKQLRTAEDAENIHNILYHPIKQAEAA